MLFVSVLFYESYLTNFHLSVNIKSEFPFRVEYSPRLDYRKLHWAAGDMFRRILTVRNEMPRNSRPTLRWLLDIFGRAFALAILQEYSLWNFGKCYENRHWTLWTRSPLRFWPTFVFDRDFFGGSEDLWYFSPFSLAASSPHQRCNQRRSARILLRNSPVGHPWLRYSRQVHSSNCIISRTYIFAVIFAYPIHLVVSGFVFPVEESSLLCNCNGNTLIFVTAK